MRRAGARWTDLQAVAVTSGPGLAGALLVGVSFGKALAYALKVPLVAVNHLEGHVASAWIEQPDFPTPAVVLIASGGHTHLYLVRPDHSLELLGRTLDDAAGEAFDKAAKMLGLGYPGGPAVDRVAQSGDPGAIRFPRPYLTPGSLDFSFSGLKTSLLYRLRDLDRAGRPRPVADLAAGFQEAIVDVLVEKAFRAVRRLRVKALAVVGGVSANSRLRARLEDRAAAWGVTLALPPLAYCTDNAAMIAAAGRRAYLQGRFAPWDLEAAPELPLSETLAAKPRGTIATVC
jgi:N6-L-threonylcarbamoyladenine synthase